MGKIALMVLMIILSHFVLFGPVLYCVVVYNEKKWVGHEIVLKSFKVCWRQHFYYAREFNGYRKYAGMFEGLAMKTVHAP